jgi:hypothetical protein
MHCSKSFSLVLPIICTMALAAARQVRRMSTVGTCACAAPARPSARVARTPAVERTFEIGLAIAPADLSSGRGRAAMPMQRLHRLIPDDPMSSTPQRLPAYTCGTDC